MRFPNRVDDMKSSISIMTLALALALASSLFNCLTSPASEAGIKSQTAKITVGPFDIHRKYRSMEGPYVRKTFRLGDLVQSKSVSMPESAVQFVEGTATAPGMAASMNAAEAAVEPDLVKPIGLVDSRSSKRELLWFKGIKLQVLDENDKPLPTAEFICHLNIDADLRRRDALFKQSDHPGNGRVITLTQGQTEFSLPEGFALPVCSDEEWTFIFQAANRTTDKHRRLKHLCTMEFVRDSDLPKDRSFKALTWFNPYIAVIVDGTDALPAGDHGGMNCLVPSNGESAPNMVAGSEIKDREGRQLSGHWAVPPGTHTYECPITEQMNRGFGTRDRKIHAVWTHVHPLCGESSLLICNGNERTKVFSAKTKTKTANGLEIENIETVSSKDGIPIAGGAKYLLQSTYNNTTKETQDSMVAMGIFCADDKFVKPDWDSLDAQEALKSIPKLVIKETKEGVYCGIKGDGAAACEAPPTNDYAGTDSFPVFDTNKDGPLITVEKRLEIKTSAGPLHIVLDPTLAPIHATQMFKLMSNGLFDGTQIHRYEPGFVLQASNAEGKAPGQPLLTSAQHKMLRRLPLEVESQKGKSMHTEWVLSMARYNPTDSAVSSFSVMLGNAPHLDHQYTVFGRVIPDGVSTATIKSIIEDWSKRHPFIVSIKETP